MPSARIVGDLSQLLESRAGWDALLSRARSGHVFQTLEWVIPWWEAFGAEGELFVVLAEEDGEFVGILPLYRTVRKDRGGTTRRLVRWIGDHGVGSDFLDAIVARDEEGTIIFRLLDHLLEHDGWDGLLLTDMDASSPSVALLDRWAEARGLLSFVTERNACPFLELPDSWQAFLDMPDVTFKRIVERRAVKRLHRDYAVELRVVEGDTGASVERLIELHVERWREAGKEGSFGDERKRRFYHRASEALARRGRLHLSALEINGEVEAMEYGMRYGRAYYALQGGVSRKGLALRAGNVLRFELLRSLVGAVDVVHFLRGEEEYKYRWGCIDKQTVDVALCREPGLWLSLQTNRPLG